MTFPLVGDVAADDCSVRTVDQGDSVLAVRYRGVAGSICSNEIPGDAVTDTGCVEMDTVSVASCIARDHVLIIERRTADQVVRRSAIDLHTDVVCQRRRCQRRSGQ